MNIRTLVFIGMLLSVIGARPVLATQYTVTIDTSAIQGTQGAIVFDYTSHTPNDNTVSILNFTHDGTTGLPETQGGLVQGDIILLLNPAPFTQIADEFFFNELLVPFTSFGTSISFTVQLTENAPGPGELPDEFSFFILDANRQPLLESSDPLGADALFAICVDGTTTGRLDVFDPTTFTPPDQLAIVVTVDGSLDHFLCYKSKGKENREVTLADQFEQDTYTVRNVKTFCTPTDKNGGGIVDPLTHLTEYKLKGPHEKRTNVLVENQFGAFRYDTLKTDTLLVPTGKFAPLENSVVDHFRCIKAKGTKGEEQLPKGMVVTATDQFGTRELKILKPSRLCVPTDKNSEGLTNPVDHLMCYKVRPTPKTPIEGVATFNQFGQAVLDLKSETELCVPSIKTLDTP